MRSRLSSPTVSRFALAALAFAALASGCAKHEAAPAPVRPVQLVQVATGGSVDVSVFAGEVKPRYEADLGFRIGGKIVARNVDVGARVKKGQPLARLDPADVALQVEAAKAALAAAETEATFAKAEYERHQGLYLQKFISESALDQKRNAFNANRAKFEQAKAQLAVTQNQAAYATLVTDQDGVITAVNAEAGQVVAAGQAVFRLAREDEREVAIAVPENRIGEFSRAPQLAVVLWANPKKIYPGKVREVAPAVDPVTRTFAVRVSILDPDPTVGWGMTANVVLREPSLAGAVFLPLSALYRQNGTPAIWIYDPKTHTVSLRAVTVGQFREDAVVVTSGVTEGEWVVGAGVNKLTPGQTVRPYDAGAAATPLPPAAPDSPAKS